MPVMITARDLAEQMRIDVHTVYEWARRKDDPLPLRTAKERTRSSVIVVSEFLEWWERNSRLFKDV